MNDDDAVEIPASQPVGPARRRVSLPAMRDSTSIENG